MNWGLGESTYGLGPGEPEGLSVYLCAGLAERLAPSMSPEYCGRCRGASLFPSRLTEGDIPASEDSEAIGRCWK